MDTVWKTRQSIVWDMRHDRRGGPGGWDFSKCEDRNEARRKLGHLSPMLVIGNRVDAVLQGFSSDVLDRMEEDTKEEIKRRSAEHHQFLAEVYRYQEDNGRFFLHEAIGGLASVGRTDMEAVSRDQNTCKIVIGTWDTGNASGDLEAWTNGRRIAESISEWWKQGKAGYDEEWMNRVKTGLQSNQTIQLHSKPKSLLRASTSILKVTTNHFLTRLT